MTDKKVYKSSDIVLTMTVDKKETKVCAGSFSVNSFKGATVSGEAYYVAKAVKLGAKAKK